MGARTPRTPAWCAQGSRGCSGASALGELAVRWLSGGHDDTSTLRCCRLDINLLVQSKRLNSRMCWELFNVRILDSCALMPISFLEKGDSRFCAKIFPNPRKSTFSRLSRHSRQTFQDFSRLFQASRLCLEIGGSNEPAFGS